MTGLNCPAATTAQRFQRNAVKPLAISVEADGCPLILRLNQLLIIHLRAPNARPSVALGCCSATNELVRTMAYRMYWAFIASLSVVPLMLAANETSARSGAAPRGAFTPTHSISRPFVGQSLRHHRRNNFGPFWPAVGGFYYGPDGEPLLDATPPTSGDI